jgi:hypothetical protein
MYRSWTEANADAKVDLSLLTGWRQLYLRTIVVYRFAAYPCG